MEDAWMVKGRENETQPQGACSDARPIHFLILFAFLSLLLYKVSTKLIQSPVKFFFFFLFSFFCGQEILDPTQNLFSSVSLSNTSCLSDELVYPRGSYLANRQMAKSVKLVGVLFLIQDAHSQPGQAEARTQWIQKP